MKLELAIVITNTLINIDGQDLSFFCHFFFLKYFLIPVELTNSARTIVGSIWTVYNTSKVKAIKSTGFLINQTNDQVRLTKTSQLKVQGIWNPSLLRCFNAAVEYISSCFVLLYLSTLKIQMEVKSNKEVISRKWF